MTTTSPTRLFWPDLIRATAICLVVSVHVSGSVLNSGYSVSGPLAWWWAAAIGGLGRCGVPLFFMVSGALLLSKVRVESAALFLRRRMTRILVPFAVWSVVFTLLKAYRFHAPLTGKTFLNLLVQPAYYHLWFFYSIAGLYLIAPLFRSARRSTMNYVLLLWFVTVPVTFFLTGTLKVGFNGNFNHVVPSYLGYFVLGYVLKDTVTKGLRLQWTLLAFVAGLAVTVLGTGFLTIRNGGALYGLLLDYLAPNVLAMSIALFILLRALAEKPIPGPLMSGSRALSTCSLGIFAMHPLALEALPPAAVARILHFQTSGLLAGMPITYGLVMTASLAATLLLVRAPLARNAV